MTVAASRRPPSSPSLKSADEFRIIGHHVQRRDIPAKVDGSAQFGAMDVHILGMVYATETQRVPVFWRWGLISDASAAKQVKGVIDVVTLPGSNKEDPFSGRQNIGETVAGFHEGYWPAKQGLNAPVVEWNRIVTVCATKSLPSLIATSPLASSGFDASPRSPLMPEEDVAIKRRLTAAHNVTTM